MDNACWERFWAKVRKGQTRAECWEWTACLNEAGYGIFGTQNKKIDRAHRISYRFYIGQIPEGMFVCHTCDNRKCVNPKHLFLGKNIDNVNDMIRKGRQSVPPPMGGWNRFKYDEASLARFGKEPDAAIALTLGVSKHAIQRERKRRNIPAFPCETKFKQGGSHPRWGTPNKKNGG